MTFKHKRRLILPGMIISLLGSCQSSAPDTTPKDQSTTSRQQSVSPDTLVNRYQDFTKSMGNCDSLSMGCVRVEMRYPVFTQPLEDSVIGILNDVVQRFILATHDGAGMATGLETFSKQFFNDYQIMQEDIPDYRVNWELIRRVEVLLNLPEVISLKSMEYAFTGGAHGMSATRLASYRTETGEKIKLSDILLPDFDQQLQTIGEKSFRRQWEIPADQDLDEAGFWFEKNQFRLSNNYAVTSNGLIFLYNPYEVAPYSFGTLELVVEFSEIRDLLDPESPLDPEIMKQL
ncbi:MAG: DUF3298 and DUF4163 domain-containing protein [Candidatus Marinimicrobia bacterium]|nr:DUF3298 and DUF4163 domain-containing protein [Candidatus Neomarinimicrobiota bacterium]MCF7840164.1 DUF3298 and DUF4163 domain-containing protein [Candidatus Neomarinimicrobiota bacterium]MCF7902116.1 DUF3298 and DUF4163 domain-containing protein [Candidatus Neomarinimicrobiota bacterium]